MASNDLSATSHEIGECLPAKENPENVKICTSMEMFGEEIKNATLKNNNGLIVICFVAKWSKKCKYMEEFIYDLAKKEKKVVFLMADIDDLKRLAWEWKTMSVPSCYILKRERVVERVPGLNQKGLEDSILKWKSRKVLQTFPDRHIPTHELKPNHIIEYYGFSNIMDSDTNCS